MAVVCQTINPCIHTMPGWDRSGITDQVDSACSKREAKRSVRRFAKDGRGGGAMEAGSAHAGDFIKVFIPNKNITQD